MSKEKKRPNKRAKAAQKILKESELLKIAKTKSDAIDSNEFQTQQNTLRTATANKSRPDKKRG